MQPIRATIHVAIEYDVKPKESTLRDLIEWYKKVVRMAATLGSPTSMEVKHIDQAWISYCSAVAGKQQIPTGSLMAFTQEIARAETRALELAETANGQ